MAKVKLVLVIGIVALEIIFVKSLSLTSVESARNDRDIWEPLMIDEQIQEIEDNLHELLKRETANKLKSVFGINVYPEEVNRINTPPAYMLELYNSVSDSNGRTLAENPYSSQIVRSYTEKEFTSGNYFFFNITDLDENEVVVEAELHLFRKALPLKALHPAVLTDPHYLVKIYQVLDNQDIDVPELHRLLTVHYVGAYESGWQIFNVKQAVLSWLAGDPNFGLLLTATTIFGEPVEMEFFRRNEPPKNRQPLLVLFTNEFDAQSPEITFELDESSTKLYDPGDVSLPRRKRQQPEELPKGFDEQLKSLSKIMRREKRPGTRNSEIRGISSMEIYRKIEGKPEEDPNFSSAKRRIPRSVDGKNMKKSSPETGDKKREENLKDPCDRKELYVNFFEVGLSSIIAPVGYDAFQCRGHCESPISLDLKPTNHAMIQGIMNKMNLGSEEDGVRMPCCVPTNLSGISLLYQNGENEVILKQYSDMVVDECGCH